MKILIVEDDQIGKKFMKMALNSYGECDVVEDGERAMEKIEKSFVDKDMYQLIFLDIMVPKINGQEILKKIRRLEIEYSILDEGKSVVIMTTALKDSENIVNAYENLADGYMVKPIFLEKIREVIKKHFG